MNLFEKIIISTCITLVVLIAGLLWWSPLHANHNTSVFGKDTLECYLLGIQENWLDQMLSNGEKPIKHYCVYKCENKIEYIAELEDVKGCQFNRTIYHTEIWGGHLHKVTKDKKYREYTDQLWGKDINNKKKDCKCTP